MLFLKKRTKLIVILNSTLHPIFLVCITITYVDAEATPMKVLECLQTKGILDVTRDHVSSHLQVIVISLTDFPPAKLINIQLKSNIFIRIIMTTYLNL